MSPDFLPGLPHIFFIYIVTWCKQREFRDPENAELSSDAANRDPVKQLNQLKNNLICPDKLDLLA